MSTAVAAASRFSLPQRFVELAARPRPAARPSAFAGKLIEQSINGYGKAHHLALPNIEYVLWAIVFGLIIANTVGVPKIFQRRHRHLRVLPQARHRAARRALPARRRAQARRHQPGRGRARAGHLDRADDLARQRRSSSRRSSPACSRSAPRSAASRRSSPPRARSTPTTRMPRSRSRRSWRSARSACSPFR